VHPSIYKDPNGSRASNQVKLVLTVLTRLCQLTCQERFRSVCPHNICKIMCCHNLLKENSIKSSIIPYMRFRKLLWPIRLAVPSDCNFYQHEKSLFQSRRNLISLVVCLLGIRACILFIFNLYSTFVYF
jgi:hypothetical protein